MTHLERIQRDTNTLNRAATLIAQMSTNPLLNSNERRQLQCLATEVGAIADAITESYPHHAPTAKPN